ncbi:DUF4435 domain-containing protein [Desulfovibrio sp.]|uniref:DUF4435 domain-containing protein n=1 Tax=Desulfovibrio sp. TaxID=885 RepID=UPI003077F8CF
MEKNDPHSVHRIGAQKALTFGRYIHQKSYKQATNLIMYGSESEYHNHDTKYMHDGEKHNYTASLIVDYENVLAALLALKNNEIEEFVEECRKKEKNNEAHNNVPEIVTDKLFRIWNCIFPHRKISIKDGEVTCSLTIGSSTTPYHGIDMSDGERVALYLIAQSLSIPQNKIIVIDEPELHLHRSIMNYLWTAIENERRDSLFVYITHDTYFAANHKQAKKFWIKNYDGTSWDWDKIQDSDLPEELLLSILGNRRHVIFVEGTAGSYDTKLYSKIYEDYFVVPCGSCSEVILRTKAMKRSAQLHHLKCFGIIDRDYRSQQEINSLVNDGIYTIDVAEVENLFIIEEILYEVNRELGFTDDSRIEKIKNHIINDRFKNQMQKMILEAVIANIKYKLTCIDISSADVGDLSQRLSDSYKNITIENIKPDIEKKFKEAFEERDYKKSACYFQL